MHLLLAGSKRLNGDKIKLPRNVMFFWLIKIVVVVVVVVVVKALGL